WPLQSHPNKNTSASDPKAIRANQNSLRDKRVAPFSHVSHVSHRSGAGGGFQHMLVDIDHARMSHLSSRLLIVGNSQLSPYKHAGTRIALHLGQEHVRRP